MPHFSHLEVGLSSLKYHTEPLTADKLDIDLPDSFSLTLQNSSFKKTYRNRYWLLACNTYPKSKPKINRRLVATKSVS